MTTEWFSPIQKCVQLCTRSLLYQNNEYLGDTNIDLAFQHEICYIYLVLTRLSTKHNLITSTTAMLQTFWHDHLAFSWIPNDMNNATDSAVSHCECSMCPSEASTHAFSLFSAPIKRAKSRPDIDFLLHVHSSTLCCFGYYQKNYGVDAHNISGKTKHNGVGWH